MEQSIADGKTIFVTGFSGTYKSSILSLTNRTVISTPTKFMMNLDKLYFCQESGINPVNMLAAQMWKASDYDPNMLSVERTVYDYVYFLRYHNLPEWDVSNPDIEQEVINIFRDLENKMFPNRICFITYNLDKVNIEKKLIGTDYSRSTIYSSVDDYLSKQLDYFKFIIKCIDNGYIMYTTEEISNNIFNNVYKDFNELPWIKFSHDNLELATSLSENFNKN
jgi:hypothetical protein